MTASKCVYHEVTVLLATGCLIQVSVWAPGDTGTMALLEMAKEQIKQHVDSAELVVIQHGC